MSNMSKRKRESELEDVKTLMSTEAGRRFAARLMEIAGLYRSSFTGNSTTFFNEGQRNVGIQIFTDIQLSCPESHSIMLDEFRIYKQQFKEENNA